MIIDPNKILKNSVPAPDEGTLRDLINQTYEEVCSLQRKLDYNRETVEFKYFNDFLKDSIIVNSEILLSMLKLSNSFLNSVFILMRTFLEINVDFLWMYSIFLDNNGNGEKIAKRFYQFGANSYFSMSEDFKRISNNDPFVKKVKDNSLIDKGIKRAEQLNLIDIVNKNDKKELRKLQESNWRALPGLIGNKKEIEFSYRANIASKLAIKLFNLKAAPYNHNWKTLNAFTHWTSWHYTFIEEDVGKALYLRNLNVSLGFLHDMINVVLIFTNKPLSDKLKLIRSQFIYFST
jgi:hypothetical protein